MGSIVRPRLLVLKVVSDEGDAGPSKIAVVDRHQIDAFCEGIVEGCMSGGMRHRCDFNLGAAAAVDAVANGRLDFLRPLEAAAMLQHDVYSINVYKQPQATDIMSRHCHGLGGGGRAS